MHLPAPELEPRILFVEDEFLIRAYVADCLREAGFIVLAVSDACEAMRLIEGGTPFDLVFTDINLPGSVDGFELTRWLGHHRPTLPVVLTSGGHNAARAAEVCGNVPFIAKPYDLDALPAYLRQLLNIGAA
jgi:DNA-binding NtrC family response regulator